MYLFHQFVDHGSDCSIEGPFVKRKPLNSPLPVYVLGSPGISEEQVYEVLQFVIVLASDSKELDILMPILTLPLIDPILWHLSLGPSHFNLVLIGIWILLMLVIVLKPVDEARTVRSRWLP